MGRMDKDYLAGLLVVYRHSRCLDANHLKEAPNQLEP